jgi:hypothetical protein
VCAGRMKYPRRLPLPCLLSGPSITFHTTHGRWPWLSQSASSGGSGGRRLFNTKRILTSSSNGLKNTRVQVGLGLTDFSHAWVESYLFDVYRFAVSTALLAAEVGAPARNMVQEFMMAYLTATATEQTDAATLEVTEATASSFVATRLRQARRYLTQANMLVLLTNLTGEFVESYMASPLGAEASGEGPALAQALADYAERMATDLNITAVGRGTGTMAAVTVCAPFPRLPLSVQR